MFIIAEFNPDTKSLSEIVQAFESCRADFLLTFVDDIRDFCGCMVDKNVRRITTHHFRTVRDEPEDVSVSKRTNGETNNHANQSHNDYPSPSTSKANYVTPKAEYVYAGKTNGNAENMVVVKEEPQELTEYEKALHIPSLEHEYSREISGLDMSPGVSQYDTVKSARNKEKDSPFETFHRQVDKEMAETINAIKEKTREIDGSMLSAIVRNHRLENKTMDKRLQDLENYQRPPKSRVEATCHICKAKISLGFRTMMHGAVKLEHAKTHMTAEVGKEISDHDVELILLSERCFPFETEEVEPHKKRRK